MPRFTVSPSKNRQPGTRVPSPPRRGAARVAILALALFGLGGLGCGGDIEARMAEVRALQDVGQFTESIDELRDILAISPDLPEATYRLGVALVQTGEPSRAVWALQKASESPDYAIPAGVLLASVYLDLRLYEDVVRTADKVLEIDPERAVVLQLRARGNLGASHLDEALTDSERLIELYPDDYMVRAIHAQVLADMGRLEEAKEAYDLLKEMGPATGDPENERRGCLAPARFADDHLKDVEQAEVLYEDCIAKYPTHGFVLNQTVKFFDNAGKPERATELVRNAVEQAPENLSLRSTLAERLRAAGDVDGAEEVLLEAAESFGSAAAWNRLATFYRQEKNSEKALGAIEKVVELSGGGSDQLRFTQADVLVDFGELERAEEVAKSLKEPTYANLIRGRILLAQGDAAAALEAFDRGIRNWPNNPGARYLAGLAAYELGRFDRAVSELRESMRADNEATEAALLLARIHFERGEYQRVVAFANRFLRRGSTVRQAEAYVLGARAFTKLGQYDRARNVIQLLRRLPGEERTAVFELAAVARAAAGPAAVGSVIEQSGLDLTEVENEELLRSLADSLMEMGEGEAALEKVDATLALHPEVGSLHELRGNLLARSNRDDEARAAYAKASELDPENAAALGGLATLAWRGGNVAEAISLFERAAELDPDKHVYAYSAAQLLIESGDNKAAEAHLRQIVRRSVGHAGARNSLAWILNEEGKNLDLALKLAEEARRLDPSPDILDTLGWVHLKRGETSAAVAVLEEAFEARPDSPTIRYHLGSALSQAGDAERAREMLKNALDAGAFPEAEDARRELAQLLEQP